jgi:putative membrane protein
MFFYIFSFILGLFTGTFTGLIPGIHTNLIMSLLILINLKININYILVYSITTALTHTFIDFIPTIYFGAPSQDTLLGVSPGHKFLLNKKAHNAVIYTLYGSIIAIILLIIISPLFYFSLFKIYNSLQVFFPLLLILTILFLVYNSKKREVTLIIIILSSILGLISLNANLNQPLLPLLTGFFGLSQMIISTKNNSRPPEQEIKKMRLSKKELIKPTLTTLLLSPVCSILPGLGASQAATFGQLINKNKSKKQYLILLGSINTLVLSTSILTLFLINKKRTGLANFISQITTLNKEHLFLIFLTILATTIFASILTINISRLFAKNINKINYKKLNYSIIILIIFLTISISKFVGLIILVTSTLIGLITIKEKCNRTIMMSSIIIPTIVNYIF